MQTGGWTHLTYSVTSKKTTYKALYPFWWTDYPYKEGTYHSLFAPPSSWPFFLSPCQHCVVWTHDICCQSCWISLCFWMHVITAGAQRCSLRHWLQPCSPLTYVEVSFQTNLQAGMTHGTGLWEACCLHRGLNGRDGVLLVWCLCIGRRRWCGTSARHATMPACHNLMGLMECNEIWNFNEGRHEKIIFKR